jgi:hypothetical protein
MVAKIKFMYALGPYPVVKTFIKAVTMYCSRHLNNAGHFLRHHIIFTPPAVAGSAARFQYQVVKREHHIAVTFDVFVIDSFCVMFIWRIVPVIAVSFHQVIITQVEPYQVALAFEVNNFHA